MILENVAGIIHSGNYGNLSLKLLIVIIMALHSGCVIQSPPSLEQPSGSHLPLPASLANKVVRVMDLPDMGNSNAALGLIEVTDYECPYCQAHYRRVLPMLKQEFIDGGLLNYYVFDYPSAGNENSELASLAAACAADQQSYWRLHDALFENPTLGGAAELYRIVNELGLDAGAFENCLERQRNGEFLDSQRATALGLGIEGTPTFLLGRLENGRILTNISVLPGMQSIAQFRQAIRRYRDESGSRP